MEPIGPLLVVLLDDTIGIVHKEYCNHMLIGYFGIHCLKRLAAIIIFGSDFMGSVSYKMIVLAIRTIANMTVLGPFQRMDHKLAASLLYNIVLNRYIAELYIGFLDRTITFRGQIS